MMPMANVHHAVCDAQCAGTQAPSAVDGSDACNDRGDVEDDYSGYDDEQIAE